MAIRGTIVNGECMTDFTGESEIRLSQHYGGCDVKFMNDVQGMAYGIHYRKDESQFLRLIDKYGKIIGPNPLAP